MSLWDPVYRIKVGGNVVTNVTLSGLTINSGRQNIYSQPQAGYCQLSLIKSDLSAVDYEINDSITIEVKKTNGSYVYLFGGYLTDVAIEVNTSTSVGVTQKINIIAVGALAKLARATYNGNLASGGDGDQILAVISGALFNDWNSIPSALTWDTYDPTIPWTLAGSNGIGVVDTPGDYTMDSQNNLLDNILSIATKIATSAIGVLREDSQGRICYDDSTHRTQYLINNGYIDLDASKALSGNLNIAKQAGDVRNSITISYTSSGNSSYTAKDTASIATYGELAANISTTLKNASDAQDQANFYLSLKAYPQFTFKSITFEIHSREMTDTERDALLQVFMGMPVNLTGLPINMVNGEFQGFVEGWTWTAGYNRLRLTMVMSPIAYSIQTFRWSSVPTTESWNTLSPTLTWLEATIVA